MAENMARLRGMNTIYTAHGNTDGNSDVLLRISHTLTLRLIYREGEREGRREGGREGGGEGGREGERGREGR